MTANITALRAQAKEHAKQLESVLWLTVNELAVRWNVSDDTVRQIPRVELPYLTLGMSAARRYDPRDVERYESTMKHGSDTP